MGTADGMIDGNRPAALPGLISLLVLTSLNDGSGTGSIPTTLGAGSGAASGTDTGAMNCTESETLSGCTSVSAETSPTALTMAEVAVCLAVTWA